MRVDATGAIVAMYGSLLIGYGYVWYIDPETAGAWAISDLVPQSKYFESIDCTGRPT